MNEAPRYATLRDYLRVLRARRALILLCALAFGGAAFALSSQQDAVYRSEASLAVQDPVEDLDLVGTPGPSRQSISQRATLTAELITRPAVVNAVVREIGPEFVTRDQLEDVVSAHVEAQTNLVVIVAEWGDARFASRLANEFARQARRIGVRDERRRYREAAASLRREYRELRSRARRGGGDGFTSTLFVERIARLEALQDFAEPVEVAKLADAPGEKVAPKTTRDALLGALLGLTLGIIAAFFRDALDRRVQRSSDAEHELDLPTIGHVPEAAFKSARRRRAGPLRPEEVEPFAILRANLSFLGGERAPRTILVTSALPEEGKSTVTVGLARSYANAGHSVLVIECDLRRPALAERFDIAREPGVSDYVMNGLSLTDVTRVVGGAREQPSRNGSSAHGEPSELQPGQFFCISAGTPTSGPAELLSSARFRELLGGAAQRFDIVLVDSSPILPVGDTRLLVPLVDGVLMCLRAGSTTREQAAAARAALSRLPERPAGLVVTGVRAGDEVDHGYYAAYAHPGSA